MFWPKTGFGNLKSHLILSLRKCVLWSKQDFKRRRLYRGSLTFRLSDFFTLLILFTPLKIIALSVQFLTKLTFAEQVSVKNTCTEFHRNPTDGLVADAVSQTDIFFRIMRLKWVEYGNQLRTLKYLSVHCTSGARGGAVGWGTEVQAERSRVRFTMVSPEFFIDIILPAALWPWG